MHIPGQIEIDLNQLERNFKIIQKTVGKSEVAAVVKADAYGLGMSRVARKLKKIGCQHFFVASLDEGRGLRETLGSKASIYVLAGLGKGENRYYLNYKLTPVLNSLEQLELLKNLLRSDPKKGFAINIDTGMNRLGLTNDDFVLAVSELEIMAQNAELVMTHLVESDKPNSKKNASQLKKFNELAKFLPHAKKSIANSGGIALGKHFHLDLVRPGISLYCAKTLSNRYVTSNTFKITTPIIQIREIKSNETIGYDSTYKVTKGDRVAIIPCGYADGLHRSLSSKGSLFIDEHEVPIIGRVSMDLAALDISHIAHEHINIGDEVIISDELRSIERLAKKAETISYELMTQLGNRWRKIYKN